MDFLVSGHQREDFEGIGLGIFWLLVLPHPDFGGLCMVFLVPGRQNEDFEGFGLAFPGFWCCRTLVLGVLHGFSGSRASKRVLGGVWRGIF